MIKYFLLMISFIIISCNIERPTQFSEKALLEKVITVGKSEITFNDVLKKYEGKKVVIDFWASWCGDCIRGLPSMVALQKEQQDVVYVFMSVDSSYKAWMRGVKKYRIQGEHYFLPLGDDGALGSFINLSWIPRYMVIGEDGTIKLFKAVKANDKRIIEALKN